MASRELTGGYVDKIRRFSRNARLYIMHVVGMDVIHGTWEVLFNLYLLAAGFSLQFIGLRLLIGGIAGAVASIPMGVVSDRLGRKMGFILGDGVGALIGLVNIMTLNPTVLLITPLISEPFGVLHNVTEPPFMAENSEPPERVHLFSVSGGIRVLAAMVGSAVAGAIPVLGRESVHFSFGEIPHHLLEAGLGSTISLYRVAVFIGLAGWFLSLIPAILLRGLKKGTLGPTDSKRNRWLRLGNVKHKARIIKLVVADAFTNVGAGFVVPLFSVFFLNAIGADELQIGTVFAIGAAALSAATFLAPYVSERLGKVRGVATFRMASIPFILVVGLSPRLASMGILGLPIPGVVLLVAALGYTLRSALMNMTGPLYDAFTMEILDPEERATATAIIAMDNSLLTSIGVFLGASLMGRGDFTTPFLIMTAFYFVSTALFYVFFKRTS